MGVTAKQRQADWSFSDNEMFRKLLGMSLLERMPTGIIRAQYGNIPKISQTFSHRRLQWLGHVCSTNARWALQMMSNSWKELLPKEGLSKTGKTVLGKILTPLGYHLIGREGARTTHAGRKPYKRCGWIYLVLKVDWIMCNDKNNFASTVWVSLPVYANRKSCRVIFGTACLLVLNSVFFFDVSLLLEPKLLVVKL
jgi:hypothetical protein